MKTSRWVRAKDGIVAGVCKGLGERFAIEVWILRALWLISILCFGVGFLFYFILAVSLPREDLLEFAYKPKLLGVCSRMAEKYDFDIGVLRTMWCLIALSSFGTALVAYIIFGILMPKSSTQT